MREPLSSKLSTSLRFTKHPFVQTCGFKVTGGVVGKTLAAKVRDLAARLVIKPQQTSHQGKAAGS